MNPKNRPDTHGYTSKLDLSFCLRAAIMIEPAFLEANFHHLLTETI
jgi:hypothetical protein